MQEVEIMTDLEHPHVIRMIASFTGLDFGKLAGAARNPRALPTGRRQISKRNSMKDEMSESSDSSERINEASTPYTPIGYGPSRFAGPSPNRELDESPARVHMMGQDREGSFETRRRNLGARYEPLNVMMAVGNNNETIVAQETAVVNQPNNENEK